MMIRVLGRYVHILDRGFVAAFSKADERIFDENCWLPNEAVNKITQSHIIIHVHVHV